MSNIKDVQQIQALMAEGKKKGFLTFDELNKALPSEVNTPEQIDEIIVIFDQLDIDIVDEKLTRGIEIAEDDGEEVKDEEKLELAEDEDGADYSMRSNDPVRMYAREMGAVGLLDRDGEVYIAKKIRGRRDGGHRALIEVPVAVEELVRVGEDLKKGRMKLKDVVKTIEEDDPSEEEMNQRERVIKLLEDVKNIYRKRPLYTRLDECATLDKRVYGVQKKIMDYKTEVIQCLRDIKLEKTLIDRIIETVGDYVRQMHNCRRDLSAYILSLGKSQDEIFGIFRQLDARSINPVAAADQLGMTMEELFPSRKWSTARSRSWASSRRTPCTTWISWRKFCGVSARAIPTPLDAQAGTHPGQPASGRVHRQEIYQPRPGSWI